MPRVQVGEWNWYMNLIWAVVTKKKSPSIGIDSLISNTMQQVVDSQTMNSGAREIFPQDVMCFNTFDALNE